MENQLDKGDAAGEPGEKHEELQTPVAGALQKLPQHGPSEEGDSKRGDRTERPTFALADCAGLADGAHQRRREKGRGDSPAPDADSSGEQQVREDARLSKDQ